MATIPEKNKALEIASLKAKLSFLISQYRKKIITMYNKIVSAIVVANPSHNENGSAFMKRTTWFNNHIEAVSILPRYNATGCSGEIIIRKMHP